MEDAHDFNHAIASRAEEHEVCADGELAITGADVIDRLTEPFGRSPIPRMQS